MTIYTEQLTGKQYDRMPGGLAINNRWVQPYVTCYSCAFSNAGEQGEECARAIVHCTQDTGNKAVYFYFKERKA